MTQKKRLRKQNVKKTNDEKTHKEQIAPATMDEMKKYLQDQLFNNEMIKQARESMTPEQLEEYKKKGEEFFANVDFDFLHI